MVEINKPVVKLLGLQQVCMVVHDVDKTMETFWKTFGIGPWNVTELTTDTLQYMYYHGKPTIFSFKVARLQNKPGFMELELIQPLEGPTCYRDFLDQHGEGVHHLGWHVLNTLEEFEKESKALEDAGYMNLTSGGSDIARFAYFDTTKTFNTVLELLWVDPKAELPHQRVYPDTYRE